MRDQAVKFSRCMRQHGIDMGDPEVVSGGGLRVRIGGGGGKGKVDPESPAFRDAQEACKAFNPKRAGPK
jgi:hypothetical protein